MNSVIGALRVVLGLDTASFETSAKAAQSRAKALGASIKSGLMIAAAAAVAAGGTVAMAVKGVIDEADDMSKAASKIGVPIEELSRLKYAADLSGVSFEGLQTAVGKLSKQMNEAKNGSKGAIDAFAQIGVSATNADGSLKSSSQVLAEISEKFAAMPDGAEKTALAMELMGRSGAGMIPLLNGGADALSKLMGEASTFGKVFTADMGANAEVFNDNISRLQGVVGNIAAELTSALLPALAQFSDYAVGIAASFRNLDPSVKTFVATAAALTAGLAAAAIPLAAIAISIAAIGAPITLVVGGIALLTAGIVAFWPEIQTLGTTITTFLSGAWAAFEGAWDGIVAKVQAVKDSIKAFAADLVAAFAALPGQMMEIGGQIIDGLINGIKAKWDSVKAGVSDIASGIKDSFTGFFDINSPSRVMSDIGGFIIQGLSQGITGQKAAAVGAAEAVASDVNSALSDFESIGQSLGQSLGSAFAGLIDGSKEFKDVLKDLGKTIASTLANDSLKMLMSGLGLSSGASGGGFLGSLFSSILPGFANGGSITPGGAGGIDSQVVAFRKSPTEQVDIYDPRKRKTSSGGSFRGGDIIIQGDASEKTVALIDARMKANNRQIAYAQGNQWRSG